MDYYKYIRPLLFSLPAEMAHNLAITALEREWVPRNELIFDDRLGVQCCGLSFDSPIGLAAGFDKNARVTVPCFKQGFGFVEVGTVTPKPQSGNPKPRMFRLKEDNAVINRLGFNNEGVHPAVHRVELSDSERYGILGINIGKNKETVEALDDYLPLLRDVFGWADYITVNISSPNTEGLRDLQSKDYFDRFIKAIIQERNGIAACAGYKRPVFVKIAPDMQEEELYMLLDTLLLYKVDGVIISNTTIARAETLSSQYAHEKGGVSGAPLTQRACAMLADAYRYTKGELPIIGVGGIMSGQDAVQRIRAGAALIQLYSGLVYSGFALIPRIKKALLVEVEKEQVRNVEALIGIDA